MRIYMFRGFEIQVRLPLTICLPRIHDVFVYLFYANHPAAFFAECRDGLAAGSI